jgi:pimeloyl-ACP methyl ester carboxylesterase
MSTDPWTAARVTTGRHETAYLSAGPTDGTPIVLVHGWPELSISWRHQIPHLADQGFRVIAPDLRGYGGSSTYDTHAAYAQEAVVADMLELADALHLERAVWVGHDWGCATVWSIARHHPERVLAIANFCVPYLTLEVGWPGLLPYIDRDLYPEAEYPAGQWEYQRYYEEHFAEATAAFDEDPRAVCNLLFRKGNPDGRGQVAATAMTRKSGGWFGGGPIPDLPRDADVISEADLDRYAEALARNTFFGPDSYYMNHERNAAYAARTPDARLRMPVLFVHAAYDYTCETIDSTLAEPMRAHCEHLTEETIPSGHWIAQEQPDAVNDVLDRWLQTVL